MFTDPTSLDTVGTIDSNTYRCPCGLSFTRTTKRVRSTANPALATSVEDWSQFYAWREFLAEHRPHGEITS